MNRILAYVFGTVQAELISADPAAALTYYGAQGLRLREPELTAPLTLTMTMDNRTWRRLEQLAQSRGDRCRCLSRRGLAVSLARGKRRLPFWIALAFLFLAVLYAPNRVWFVEVEGNGSIPDRQILAAAEACGVRFWAKAGEIRSEQVKNKILNLVPELQWAGVNFSGGVAIVSVRERLPEEAVRDRSTVTNVVAARDGVIVKLEVTGGQAMVQVGDAVVKDMLLVSGVVENTAGAVFKRSQGRVLARTERELEVRVPLQETRLLPTGRSVYRPTLQLFGLHIPLYTDGEVEGDYSLTTRRHPVVANGVNLPLGYTEEIYTMLSPQEVRYSETEAAALAAAKLDAREAGELAGTDIQSTSRNGRVENGYYILTGTYVCIEDIGVEEQILIADS